ncbi:MAG TPA: DsbA family protein [Candidatus Nanoarchaeia archaeon]|nr:DsbA family protein [Candidatus Nanoarchaeia archaeon]
MENENLNVLNVAKGKAPSNRNNLLLVASLIQIVLLIVVISKLGVNTTSPTGGVVVDDSLPSPTVPLDMQALIDDDAIKGDPKAPVTIIEFSDFECPFCGRFYTETLGKIDEKYIKTGKVRLVYRDFPLSFHPQAQKAAETAECAGDQNKYYDMHDKLFELGVSGGVASFKQYAKDLGLDTAKFNACLDSGEKAAEISNDFIDGQNAGIQGTPGFIVNGIMISGAQPYQVFEQVIESLLK